MTAKDATTIGEYANIFDINVRGVFFTVQTPGCRC